MDIPNIVGMLACISCINICIYIYIYIYVYAYACGYVQCQSDTHTHTHMYIYIDMHTYVYTVHCVHTGTNNRSATCSSQQSLAHSFVSFVEEP